ncbi:hypothetical protein [Apis mellifera associated microvirus 15]|nr:hypothetical protein [Apis mellifera associated microvirus 15]
MAYKPAPVRGFNNYDPDAASAAVVLDTGTESKVQQHQLEETDINVIVRRFTKTGELPAARLPPAFGDFSNAPTFFQAQMIIREAQEAFDALPVEVRNRFRNDPAAFVEFATKEENADELRKMGLLDPVPVPDKAPEPPEKPGGRSGKRPDPTPKGGDENSAHKAGE